MDFPGLLTVGPQLVFRLHTSQPNSQGPKEENGEKPAALAFTAESMLTAHCWPAPTPREGQQELRAATTTMTGKDTAA